MSDQVDLFGGLDADDIPDNPYFVDDGTYEAEITEAVATQTKDNVDKIRIEYTIDDEEDEFGGNSVSEWFNYYPHLSKSDLEAMPKKEANDVRKKASRLKQRLGHLGEDPKDPNLTLAMLVGKKVRISVQNNGDFTNVRRVELR